MPSRPPEAPAPDETEKQIFRELTRGAIRAQGNTFIKELLLEKGIRIGARGALGSSGFGRDPDCSRSWRFSRDSSSWRQAR